jgi:hypothetical protein
VLLDPWFFHTTVFVVGLAGLALGILASLGRRRDVAPSRPPSARRPLGLILVGAVLLPTFLALPGPPWFHPISGDEPHYLVIARSLWVDGDVDVANDYREGLWQPFWSGELSEHAKPGADASERYSIHGSGLAVWLAPWFGAGSNLSESAFNVLIRFAMSLWLAAAAAALFFLLRDVAGLRSAVYGTSLAVFTLPLVFAGPHVFPAVPVFALSCAAYTILRRAKAPKAALAAGLLLAALPWLHFKFFGLMAAVAATGGWWIWKEAGERRRVVALAALAAPLLLTTLGHVAFTWELYGRLSPLAIHVGADPTLRATAAGDDWVAYLTDPVGAAATAIGYLLDQREGLLFYAPQYLLAAAGLGWMWTRRRRDAVALGLVFAALVGPYALSQEIGHWAPPARPLTGVLWALALPMGIGAVLPAGNERGAPRREALRGVLITAGACATATMLLQADLLYHDYNVGRSLVLLRYGAPGLPLSGIAPLWLGPDAVRWGPSMISLMVAAAAAVFLWRWGKETAETLPARSRASLEGAAVRSQATRAAAGFVVAAAALMLWHHARVPLTDLHQAWTFGPIRVWKPQSPPTRAWATDRGVWTGGHDSVQMLLSSREPIDRIVLEVSALAPMLAEVQMGRDRQMLSMVPGQRLLTRLTPGPGARWRGEYFYHLNVVAHGGVSRAALGIDEDSRGLGVFLQLVQLEGISSSNSIR